MSSEANCHLESMYPFQQLPTEAGHHRNGNDPRNKPNAKSIDTNMYRKWENEDSAFLVGSLNVLARHEKQNEFSIRAVVCVGIVCVLPQDNAHHLDGDDDDDDNDPDDGA